MKFTTIATLALVSSVSATHHHRSYHSYVETEESYERMTDDGLLAQL